MDESESTTLAATPNRRLHAGIRTAGAVVAMVLAGLGVAEAQTGDSTTATPPAQATQPTQADDQRPKPHCGPGRHHRPKPKLEAAAEALGITAVELRAAVRGGQSIAQVARSKGVEVQKVVDAMVAEAKAHLAERVEAGDMTQAQADRKAATLTERITALVNREGLRRPRPPAPSPGPTKA